MLNCIKTGCVVWLPELAEWAYGDAFQLNDLFVFRLCERSHSRQGFMTRKHFTVHRVMHWFDEHKTSMAHNSTLLASHVTNHGYDGDILG